MVDRWGKPVLDPALIALATQLHYIKGAAGAPVGTNGKGYGKGYGYGKGGKGGSNVEDANDSAKGKGKGAGLKGK